MIQGYANQDGRLKPVEYPLENLERVIWIDLLSPTDQEETLLEGRLEIDIPTREEMNVIEISSRLYIENGAAVMIVALPAKADTDEPEMAPVTFVLTAGKLITVRYHEPRSFQTFPQRAAKAPLGCTDGDTVMLALLEAIIDRLADILERVGGDIDKISREVFQHTGEATPKQRGKGSAFQSILQGVGRKGDMISKIRESLLSLERMVGFLMQPDIPRNPGRDDKERLNTIWRDAHALTDHASFLSQKINFLLDATLGMISIEQNSIIKIFSVAAVIFLPPTLIASIYGMNFDVMPELHWLVGYPFALLLMVLSAGVAIWYFKRKGWL
jgi:magnesium transporter